MRHMRIWLSDPGLERLHHGLHSLRNPPPPLRTVCNDSILFALTHMPLRSSCPGNFVLTLQWSASCSSPDLNQASPASFLRRRSVDAQRQNS